jgi:hypothetical protein
VNRSAEATLAAALDSYAQRADREKAARDKVTTDRAAFIHDFRLRVIDTIRPAMICIGTHLETKGHRYSVEERTVLSSNDGKSQLTGITMTCTVGRAHTITFEAADASNGVMVSMSPPIADSHCPPAPVLTLAALSHDAIEHQIVDYLSTVLNRR